MPPRLCSVSSRETTFEGQAAIWLEQLARRRFDNQDAYPFPFAGHELDFRPLLEASSATGFADAPIHEIARAFQRGVATGVARVAV